MYVTLQPFSVSRYGSYSPTLSPIISHHIFLISPFLSPFFRCCCLPYLVPPSLFCPSIFIFPPLQGIPLQLCCIYNIRFSFPPSFSELFVFSLTPYPKSANHSELPPPSPLPQRQPLNPQFQMPTTASTPPRLVFLRPPPNPSLNLLIPMPSLPLSCFFRQGGTPPSQRGPAYKVMAPFPPTPT